MPRTIDTKNFKIEVMESISLSIVQFKTEWSGSCQILAPVFEELSKTYEGIANFFISDIETNASFEKEFGIHEVPTILFFKGGVIIDHSTGLISRTSLVSKIENARTGYQGVEDTS